MTAFDEHTKKTWLDEYLESTYGENAQYYIRIGANKVCEKILEEVKHKIAEKQTLGFTFSNIDNEEIKECEKTFPPYTVFVYREDGEIVRAEPFSKYAKWGKTYKECSERVKSGKGYEELQDKNLYEVASLLDNEMRKTRFDTDYLDRLRVISSDIDDLLDDMDEEYGEW